MQKLAIISTHPIQYNAPFFKLLNERNNIELKVFYTWSQSQDGIKYDPGFGKEIKWDIPLLQGYDYCFVNNISTKPGSHHYKGINNPTLISEIKDWGANVVLVYGWSFISHFNAMRFFKGKIPVLFRGDSTLLDEKKGVKKIIRRQILKFIYTKIDFALYTGNANKAYFLAHGLKNDKLVFMPHAIDNERFAESEKNSNVALKIRTNLQIPSNALVFVFAGKLESKKHPHLLATVFSALKNKESHLIFAGNGILENSLKFEYENIANIHFLDFQNQESMPALYAACNVFVLPSKGPNETWGLAINEAMAAGKAIIASSACGAVNNLVENNVNGFVFENNNKNDLAKCLQYFVNNKNAATQMGQVSAQIIKEYSYQHDCIALENLLLNFENINHN